MLRVDRLRKTWPDGGLALDEVSFAVAPGEFCVLLGRSGAGKSSLLRIITGLTSATNGAVEVSGETLAPETLQAVRRRIATIHQHFNLVDRLSVAQNILSGLAAQTPLWRCLLQRYPPKREAAAAALARRVGLPESAFNQPARTLSGGQQQRVGIARALISDPDLLLADEPVASLDPTLSEEIIALLRAAARERRAAVLCSLHQTDLARAFADRIVALRAGKVVFDGPPAELSDAAAEAIYAA